MDATSAIQIVLAIGLLGSFFLAYLSSKTWKVANVVLVVCIFIASIFFWYLSAVVMKIHATHRAPIAQLEQEIKQLRQENEALESGTDDQAVVARLEQAGVSIDRGALRESKLQLRKILLDRGRVWFDAQPNTVGGDGTAQLTIEDPVPHGIASGSILYAFEQGPANEGARYLGKFQVTEAGENTVTLQPTAKLGSRELDRLTQSDSAWTLYEVMPIDRRDVFASLTDEELSELFPEASRDEYLRDGEAADETDPPERVIGYLKDGTRATEDQADQVVEKRYARRLRDYNFIFDELATQSVLDADRKEQLTRDGALLQDAIAKAQEDIAYRESERQKLVEDKQRFEQEVAVVTEQLQTVKRYLAAIESRVRQLFASQQQTAGELARVQLEAAEEINRRTEPVAAEGATQLQTAAP